MTHAVQRLRFAFVAPVHLWAPVEVRLEQCWTYTMGTMLWSRLLPRLLLTLCLVLHGIGTSAASLRMHLGDDALSIASQGSTQDDLAAKVSAMDHAMASEDHCADQPPDDCCDPGQCDGACVPSVTAIVVRAWLPPLYHPSAGLSVEPAPVRGDPALPHPVRPPIA